MSKPLLTQTRDNGIMLYLDSGKLKARAAKNALGPQLRDQMRAAKDQLISLLQQVQPQSLTDQLLQQQQNYWADQLPGVRLIII